MKRYFQTLRRLRRAQTFITVLRILWTAAGILRAAGWCLRKSKR